MRKIGFDVVLVAVQVLAGVFEVQFVRDVGVVVGVGVVMGLGVLVAGLAVVSSLGVFVLLMVGGVVRRFVRYVRPLSMGLVAGYFLFRVRFEVYFLVVAEVRYS